MDTDYNGLVLGDIFKTFCMRGDLLSVFLPAVDDEEDEQHAHTDDPHDGKLQLENNK